MGKNLLWSENSTSFASDKSFQCAFTSPNLDSSCFKLHFYKFLSYVVSSLNFVPISLGPFAYGRNRTSTDFCCFSSERPNKFPAETLQYHLFNLSLGTSIFESLRNYSPTKSNAFFVLLIFLCFF